MIYGNHSRTNKAFVASIRFRKLINGSGFLLVVLAFAWEAMTSENCGAESKWDEALLNMEFRDVSINAVGIRAAWQEITTKYLMRANIYIGVQTNSDSKVFEFKKEAATGKEILEALFAAFSAYTYTQDARTGVVWIHPKQIKYEDILKQNIKVNRPAYQIPMFSGIYRPLCSLLSPSVIAASLTKSGSPSSPYCYFVDLPSGICSARDILNYCCAANPTKAFEVGFESVKSSNQLFILIFDLHYLNPMALPRAAAVKFWEIEIGRPADGIPTADDINAALSDANPRRRWAAVAYLEAAQANYSPVKLIGRNDLPEKAVWVALGVENTLYKGIGDLNYFNNVAAHIPGITNDLMQIKDANLALIASLELAREKQDSTNLDGIISKHKYIEEEIANIRPDIYRLVNESPLVLDKLRAMKLDIPEFSPSALRDLEETNVFTLVPGEGK
jgi:hypothetical protein